MRVEDVEKLKHVAPNTPDNWTAPFSDKRFSLMWCPFHKGRRVDLLVYITDWGEPWFNCVEGCHCVQERIEGLLTNTQPHVLSYVTADAATKVYEARWLLE